MMQEKLPEWTKIIDKLLEETKKERVMREPELRYYVPILKQQKLLIEECTENRQE